MILKEIIQRVQSLYSKGVQSDDSRLSDRHIYNKLLTTRAKLIIQKVNKRQMISQWDFQTIECIELEEAPSYECPCIPPYGCVILKTKLPLPKPLTGLMQGHMLQSVTSIEGSIIFSETTWKNKKYKKGNKYTGTKPDYFIRNNHLYLTTKVGPQVISVTGLFEDPIEVESYNNLCYSQNTDCTSPLEKEFPIELDMVDTLIELVVKELLSVFGAGEDTTNNTVDNKKEK